MQPAVPDKLPIGVNWEGLIPKLSHANRELARYSGMLMGLRGADMLLAPLTTEEAVLSSRIEGTEATLEEVLQFDAGRMAAEPDLNLDFFEIANYRLALHEAERELLSRPFTLNLLLRLHGTLLDSARGQNKARGEFRRTQNWIGRKGCTIEAADFVPPPPDALPGLLGAWESFYHAETLDALVQLAMLHGQFEILHPFLDGNGRLGRILIPLFLYERKLLRRPMFYLSSYLERHRDEYIGRLRALQQEPGAWQAWCEFFLAAVAEQAAANAHTVGQIVELYETLKPRIIEVTHSQFAVMVLDAIFERPIFNTTQVAGLAHMPTRAVVTTILNQLVGAGVIRVMRPGSGRRPQMFVCDELMAICKRR